MGATIADKLETQFRQRQRPPGEWDNWRLEESDDGVLWLYLDRGDSSTNTLNAEVLTEFDSILENLEKRLGARSQAATNAAGAGDESDLAPERDGAGGAHRDAGTAEHSAGNLSAGTASAGSDTAAAGGTAPRALVIRSLKAGGFCAGADIRQFSSVEPAEVKALIQRGHGILDRLEALPLTTIAAIHGHCLGGGLEVALACDYRLGMRSGDRALEVGFPEVQLGLHPGLGGTFRLLELIDPIAAMTMMLTGRSAYDRQALGRGLVDSLIEERHLENAVTAVLDGRIGKKPRRLRHRLMNSWSVRQLASRRMQAQTARKAPRPHYPAPYALIALWRRHGDNRAALQPAEIDSFANLLETDTSRNLVRVFFLREGLKQAAGRNSDIRHVHVVGAGAMGGDIAAWCALQGYRVSLADVSSEPIAAAIRSVPALCRSRHKSAIDTRDTLDRLMPDPDGQAVSNADLVIEAVPENPELKQKIYRQLEPRLKDTAILATNTSSIPLQTLASFLSRPERLVGIHFFNPVSRMLIVEVVGHDAISETVQQQAMAFTGDVGKLPVAVQSYPGFLVNRALTPYLQEAMVLLDEGVPAERIDSIARDFGMPMGPIELADQVGLDICLHVADVLKDLLDKPMAAIPDWLREKVDKGELGRKSGQGFYRWQDGKPVRNNKAAAGRGSQADDTKDIQDRLLLPMLDACVECYRQKVVADLDQLDAAMIFATGFAPFRGGPMHYARQRGIDDIVATLESLAAAHGERFKPDPGWQGISTDSRKARP